MRLPIVLAVLSFWHLSCKAIYSEKNRGIIRAKKAVFDLIPNSGGHEMQRRRTTFWSEMGRKRSVEGRGEEMRKRREKLKFLFKHAAIKRKAGGLDMMPIYYFG